MRNRSHANANRYNWRSSKKWILENLRNALKIYCDSYKKHSVAIGLEAGKSLKDGLNEFVKITAPNLAYQLGGSKAVAIAFMFWLLKYSTDKWCDKYADKQFNGVGTYYRLSPQAEFDSFFDITYTPPIVEWVDDIEAYPLSIPKEQIIIPAETRGLVRVASKKEVDDIYFSLQQDRNHSFKDEKSESTISGNVEAILPKKEAGANILDLIARELQIITASNSA